MEIDKALDILEEILNDEESEWATEGKEALQLGIEALKRVQGSRPEPPSLAFLPLPAETRGY